DRLEVVPGREMANQRRGVESRELFLTNGEGNDGNVFRLDALVAELLVEWNVRITIDGGDDGRLLARRAEILDVGDNRLPVGMTEWRVVDHDVFLGHTLGHQVGLEDLVGGLRVDIVRAGQYPAFDALGFG